MPSNTCPACDASINADPKNAPTQGVQLTENTIPNKAAEKKRIDGELAKLAGFIKSAEAKLANTQFTEHAPAAIVEEARRKLAENREKVAQLEKLAKLFL